MPCLSASAVVVVIHYEALYQVYVPVIFLHPPWGVFTPHTMMDTPNTDSNRHPFRGVVPPYNLFSHSFVMNTLIAVWTTQYTLCNIACWVTLMR